MTFQTSFLILCEIYQFKTMDNSHIKASVHKALQVDLV